MGRRPSSDMLSECHLGRQLVLPSGSTFPSLERRSGAFPVAVVQVSIMGSSVLSLVLVVPSFTTYSAWTYAIAVKCKHSILVTKFGT